MYWFWMDGQLEGYTEEAIDEMVGEGRVWDVSDQSLMVMGPAGKWEAALAICNGCGMVFSLNTVCDCEK